MSSSLCHRIFPLSASRRLIQFLQSKKQVIFCTDVRNVHLTRRKHSMIKPSGTVHFESVEDLVGRAVSREGFFTETLADISKKF